QPAAQKVEFKIQTSFDAANPAHVWGSKLCDNVTAASGGRLVFTPFTGGSIVPATKEMDAIDLGTVDGTFTCTMYNLDKWPEAGLFSARPTGIPADGVPIWFDAWGTDFVNRMVEGYDVIAIRGVTPQPAETWCHSKAQLKSLADIKGLKIRTAGDGGEILTRMGASVVFMPGGELYEAMQRGVIDAFEYSNPAVDWPMGFQEVAKYQAMSSTRAPSDPLVFYLKKSKYEKLTPDLKAIIENCCQSTTRQHQTTIDATVLEAYGKFKAYGTVQYHLPKDIEAEITKVAKAFYDEKAASASPLYKEILASQRAFLADWITFAALSTPQA
ncbi:MAG: TRAP transporter substrate-binding protein DctP, partial [Dehalococcoidia bacterium]|nr:TRAP transporter substrate-binding protein DctP [Dehalococcoidia bacterium]